MNTILLSPHLDDAVYSCGGFIWDSIQRGETISIWTIFAGDPPNSELTPFAQSLHFRWGLVENPVARRREENNRACTVLGCGHHQFEYPDCIYRLLPGSNEPVIKTETNLFSPIQSGEMELVRTITVQLTREIPRDARLIIPLGIGEHVDHRIVRVAAEQMGRPLFYYADYPYSGKPGLKVERYLPDNATEHPYFLSTNGLIAWQDAVSAYESQLSSFWASAADMRNQMKEYSRSHSGRRLWKMTTE